jgi:hypothetical protein
MTASSHSLSSSLFINHPVSSYWKSGSLTASSSCNIVSGVQNRLKDFLYFGHPWIENWTFYVGAGSLNTSVGDCMIHPAVVLNNLVMRESHYLWLSHCDKNITITPVIELLASDSTWHKSLFGITVLYRLYLLRLRLQTLMMEAASTSETLENFYQTTRRWNPEDSHLQSYWLL